MSASYDDLCIFSSHRYLFSGTLRRLLYILNKFLWYGQRSDDEPHTSPQHQLTSEIMLFPLYGPRYQLHLMHFRETLHPKNPLPSHRMLIPDFSDFLFWRKVLQEHEYHLQICFGFRLHVCIVPPQRLLRIFFR